MQRYVEFLKIMHYLINLVAKIVIIAEIVVFLQAYI